MEIQFFFADAGITLRERKRLKFFISTIFINEGKKLSSINYIFCSDDYLLNINRQFLQHDYYTDIVTFNLSASNAPIEGEVYISIDRVRENARLLNQKLTQELHRVIFHGALHLCGYKDKQKNEIVQMRKAEETYLRRYLI